LVTKQFGDQRRPNYVHFKHENQVITLRPHLVRVIETPGG
jgi:hypothetical protein